MVLISVVHKVGPGGPLTLLFDLINSLKKTYISGYEKTEKLYKQPKENNFYQRLKSLLTKAIENSKRLPGFDPDETERAACEMHKLVEWLKIR